MDLCDGVPTGGPHEKASASFTVYTAMGRVSYRSHSKADAAARWIARESGDSVSVVNERTGQSWEVSVGRAAA